MLRGAFSQLKKSKSKKEEPAFPQNPPAASSAGKLPKTLSAAGRISLATLHKFVEKNDKEAFVLYAVVPGLTAEEIEIEILNDTVSIQGEFKRDVNEDENYLRTERPSGHFHRSLRFATKLEADKAEAKLENGILTLSIPKVSEAQPKSIKVKTK